jgi:hypothetical protein
MARGAMVGCTCAEKAAPPAAAAAKPTSSRNAEVLPSPAFVITLWLKDVWDVISIRSC